MTLYKPSTYDQFCILFPAPCICPHSLRIKGHFEQSCLRCPGTETSNFATTLSHIRVYIHAENNFRRPEIQLEYRSTGGSGDINRPPEPLNIRLKKKQAQVNFQLNYLTWMFRSYSIWPLNDSLFLDRLLFLSLELVWVYQMFINLFNCHDFDYTSFVSSWSDKKGLPSTT